MKKNVRNILLFAVLFVFGLAIGVATNQDAYITSLLYFHENTHGEFVAQDNNLATVKIRVRTFGKTSNSHIEFRLREKGTATWKVTNSYAVDRFPDGLLYPFGFPAITDSKGKTYEFTILSPDANTQSSIVFATSYHNVASQYVYTKSELYHSKKLFVTFIKNKFISLIADPYQLLYLVLWVLPAFIVFVHSPFASISVFLLLFALLPVNFGGNSSLFALFLLGMVAYFCAIKPKIFFMCALGCICFIPMTVHIGNELVSVRLSLLAFVLFILGTVFSVYEAKT